MAKPYRLRFPLQTDRDFERRVRARLAGQPWLVPVFGSVHAIPQRLREIDPDFFVVRNVRRNLEKAAGVPAASRVPLPVGVIPNWGTWLEVHHLTQAGSSLAYTVPYPHLDARVLDDIKERDLRRYGDAIFRWMDERNERMLEARRRQGRNQLAAAARESRLAFARASWGPSIFGPR